MAIRRAMKWSMLLVLLPSILPSAFAAGTKEQDFRATEGRENWDSRYDISSLPAGKYNVLIEGKDRAGNTSVAGPYNVYVDPASDLPVVTVSNLTQGQRVGGDLLVVGTAVDDDGVDKVEVALDGGEFLQADGKGFWSYPLGVAAVKDGKHTVRARAIDINGVAGHPSSVSFTLDTEKPLVRVTSHESGTLASGTLTLSGAVDDANGVREIACSTDNRATFKQLQLVKGTAATNARFSLPIDTRKLKDGPYVYWFQATDLAGSVGVSAFLFFVDNTGPALQILSPSPQQKVSGVVTVAGKITELIGTRSLAFDAGDAGRGIIALVPGNPYWVQDFDFRKTRGVAARITFTLVDLAGNATTKQVSILLLPDEADLPVVTLRSPEPSGRYGENLLVSGTIRDDDGVKAVQYSLDAAPAVTVPAAEAFAFPVSGIAPGKHRIAVRGVDTNDRSGKDATVDFLSVPNPPVVSLQSATIGARTTPFRPGLEIARDEGVVLTALVDTRGRLQSVDALFNGVAAAKPALKQSETTGRFRVDVKVPPAVPFGLVTVSLRATDEYGQAAEFRPFLHVTNWTKRISPPGIQLADPRIRPDGTVVLARGATLSGILAGEDIGSVVFDPPTDVATVSSEGERIVVSGARPGISVPLVIKVVSTRNHLFASQQLRIIVDDAKPSVAVSTPRTGDWVGRELTVTGSASDDTGLASVEVSTDGGRTFSAADPEAGAKRFDLRVTTSLAQAPDGPVDVALRCTDLAGNSAVTHAVAIKDTAQPTIAILTPRPDDGLQGAFVLSGTVKDDGVVARVELSTDGTSFSPVSGTAVFSSLIDPDALGRTPDSVTVRATDASGNVATAVVAVRVSARTPATAVAKDVEKPVLELLFPPKDARLYRTALFIGRLFDAGGLKKLSFDAGAGMSGSVDLLPGSPYWAKEIDFSGLKGQKPTVTFVAEDLSGNTTQLRYQAAVDPTADQPAVTVLQPSAKARVEGALLLSGVVRDADGVQGVFYSLDGGAETQLPGAGAFAALLEDVPEGSHKLVVRAVDGNGLGSPRTTVEFTASGPAPSIALAAVVQGKESREFYAGMAVSLDGSTSLAGTLSVPGGMKSAQYAFGDGPAKQLPASNAGKAGRLSFEVPLAAELPRGRVDLRVAVTDAFDRRAESAVSFYRVDKDTVGIQDAEGVQFVDSRISQDGAVLLAPGDSLAGYFNGRPVRAAVLEPETPFVEIAVDGNFLTLSAVSEGLREGARVRVTTVDGDTFLSAPLSLRVDADAPSLVLDSPRTGDWTGATIVLKGLATDANGIAAVEYAVGPSGPFAPVTLSRQEQGGAFELSFDAGAIADGDVPVTVRTLDAAGRAQTVSVRVMKDTKAPSAVLLTPPAGEAVNGLVTVAGTAADEGVIARVEYSEDGAVWSPVEGTSVFRRDVDLSRPASPEGKPTFRVIDKSGNAALFTPELNVQQAADAPEVQIQTPPDGEVQRNDFTVSGTVFDDDGVGAISWRIDAGDFVKLPGSHSFSIPIALKDVADNEHTIEVRAEDRNGVPSEPRTATFKVSKAEPTSRLLSPALSATSRGVITLAGESSDANGIAGVWVSFDNGRSFDRAEGKERWTYRLNTRVLADGTYSLFVRAVDAYGTEGFAATLLNVDNTPPEIVLDTPADGAGISGTLVLAGRARDNIELFSLKASVAPLGGAGAPTMVTLPSTGPFARSVDLAGLAPGWYDLSLEGTDKAANTTLLSRNLRVEAASVADKVEVWFPANGEDLRRSFTVAGRLESAAAVSEAVLLLDGTGAGSIPVNDRGYFLTAVDAGSMADGPHSIAVEAKLPDGRAVRSEPRSVIFGATGPWIRITSHTLEDLVTNRPFISGEAGWAAAPVDASDKAAVANARRASDAHRIVRVDISLDNGRTFLPAQGTEKWRFRLETQNYPDGPVRLLSRAVYASGESALDRTIMLLDDTPPVVVLLAPREEGRFNGEIPLTGTASDENGVAQVRAAVRKGDKAAYEVPTFIQGLYFDAHLWGATMWDVGAGITFFDGNVKLQAQAGIAPEGRFSGLFLGAKLLANVARLPFGYLLGPDWDFLSMSFAVGANFSFVTNSGTTIEFTDKGLILGAVVGQIEFPIVRLKSLPVLNTYSLYTEYQLWFISSDVSAGFASRLGFGVRVGLF